MPLSILSTIEVQPFACVFRAGYVSPILDRDPSNKPHGVVADIGSLLVRDDQRAAMTISSVLTFVSCCRLPKLQRPNFFTRHAKVRNAKGEVHEMYV